MFLRGCLRCLVIGIKTDDFDYLVRLLKAGIIAWAGESR